MRYSLFDELPKLVADKMVSARRHSVHPLTIYNYTVSAQMTPMAQWTEAMKDCRGLILDDDGEIIGRPFRKFWNLEQYPEVLGTDFTVWEKLDGSLGIACYYAGDVIVATRGSFESDQARWFDAWIHAKHPHFFPSGETYLFEIIYPDNRIVVDYGKRQEAVLLGVMSPDGVDLWHLFDSCARFTKARRFDGMASFDDININPVFAGEEGFVCVWPNGFRAKVKIEEYKRLHRLITQCSTRTIWELLRDGTGTQELMDRVPDEFAEWVNSTAAGIRALAESIRDDADTLFRGRPECPTRKEFASWALSQSGNHSLLFSLLDGKDITDACWKVAEPKWATPFRKDIDA